MTTEDRISDLQRHFTPPVGNRYPVNWIKLGQAGQSILTTIRYPAEAEPLLTLQMEDLAGRHQTRTLTMEDILRLHQDCEAALAVIREAVK